MNDLPESWLSVRLGEVARILSGYAFKSTDYSNEGMALLRISNIQDGAIDLKEAVRVPPEKQKLEFQVEQGDILLALSGATTGKSGVYTDPQPALLNQRVGNIRPITSDVLDKKFLWYYIKSNRKDIERAAYGGAQPNISPKDISDFVLPLAPLNEQKRIVAKLDELLPKVEACKERLQRALVLLGRARRGLYDLAIPATAEKVRLESLLLQAFDGPFGSSLKTSDYVSSGIRVVRLENIGELTFIKDKVSYVSKSKAAELSRHTLRAQDIVFSSFVTDRVRCCVLGEDEGGAINKADCFCLRVDKSKVNPLFLAIQLTSKAIREQIGELVHGATRPRVNLKQVKQLEVSVCSLNEQLQMANGIVENLRRIKEHELKITNTVAFLDRVSDSILSKAFSGNLVFQDPTDEPASALLECIKQSSAQNNNGAVKSKSGKRGRKGKEVQVSKDGSKSVAATTA